MKIAIVYWTYNKDYKLIELTLAAIPYLKRKYPDMIIDVYVFDDANFPCIEKFPDFVNYQQTTFNRNGNLNGMECITGMLKMYYDISIKGYDWIIKCDSDTYINHLDWIKDINSNDFGLIGNKLPGWGAPYGCLIAYSPIAIKHLYEHKIFETKIPEIFKGFPQTRFADDFSFFKTITFFFKPLLYKAIETTEPGSFNGVFEFYNKKQKKFKTFDIDFNKLYKHWGVSFKRCDCGVIKDQRRYDLYRIWGLERLEKYIRWVIINK